MREQVEWRPVTFVARNAHCFATLPSIFFRKSRFIYVHALRDLAVVEYIDRAGKWVQP